MERSSSTKFSLLGFMTLVFIACNSTTASFEGTYINHAASEFSIADDTLIVEKGKDQVYLIHRKTGYRILGDNGKPGKLQTESEEWKAVYDAGSNSMTENRKGRIIRFENQALILENSTYRRKN